MAAIEMKTKKDYECDAGYDVDTLIRAQEILDHPKRREYALKEIQKRYIATDKAEAQLLAKTSGRLKKIFGKK